MHSMIRPPYPYAAAPSNMHPAQLEVPQFYSTPDNYYQARPDAPPFYTGSQAQHPNGGACRCNIRMRKATCRSRDSTQ
jgi:hypothetical protein